MGSIFKKSIFISVLLAEKCKFLDNVKSGEIMISEHYNICPPTQLRLPTNISAPAHPHNSLRLQITAPAPCITAPAHAYPVSTMFDVFPAHKGLSLSLSLSLSLLIKNSWFRLY